MFSRERKHKRFLSRLLPWRSSHSYASHEEESSIWSKVIHMTAYNINWASHWGELHNHNSARFAWYTAKTRGMDIQIRSSLTQFVLDIREKEVIHSHVDTKKAVHLDETQKTKWKDADNRQCFGSFQWQSETPTFLQCLAANTQLLWNGHLFQSLRMRRSITKILASTTRTMKGNNDHSYTHAWMLNMLESIVLWQRLQSDCCRVYKQNSWHLRWTTKMNRYQRAKVQHTKWRRIDTKIGKTRPWLLPLVLRSTLSKQKLLTDLDLSRSQFLCLLAFTTRRNTAS